MAPKRLRAALEKFKQLPPEKRQARVEELPGIWKGKALPQPPEGGLILRQCRRVLHRDAEGRMHVVETQTLVFDGNGTVRIGDTVWRVAGPDTPAGTRVKVVQVDGANLTVAAA